MQETSSEATATAELTVTGVAMDVTGTLTYTTDDPVANSTIDPSWMVNFQRSICEGSFCSDLRPGTYCGKQFPDLLAETVASMKDPDGVCTETRIIIAILYSLITAMSLIGNCLVILTFVLDKNMRSVTNIFIISLAAADLMVTVACVPFNMGTVFSAYWVFGRFACKLVPFFMTFSVACSSLTLCAIALDRYIAILHPHKMTFLRNPKPAAIFLGFIWVVSGLCSAPNTVFYDVTVVETKCVRPDHENNYICHWPDNRYKVPLELWVTLIFLFIIPFAFMALTYGIIGYRLWIRRPLGIRRNSHDNYAMKKSVIKMLVIVMVAFVICWCPIMVLNSVVLTLTNVTLSVKTVMYLKVYFQCLSMVNCCINPVIYSFMNRNFRTKFANYLCCRSSNRIFAAVIHSTRDKPPSTHAVNIPVSIVPRNS